MESSGITLFSLFYLNPHSFHYQDMLVLHQKITRIRAILTFLVPLFQARSDHLSPTCLCAVCCAKSVQLCPTLCDPIGLCSSVHGILQARILEWVAMPSSGDIPDPGIKPKSLNVSCIGSQVCFLFLFLFFLPLMLPGKPLHDSDSLSFLIFIF